MYVVFAAFGVTSPSIGRSIRVRREDVILLRPSSLLGVCWCLCPFGGAENDDVLSAMSKDVDLFVTPPDPGADRNPAPIGP